MKKLFAAIVVCIFLFLPGCVRSSPSWAYEYVTYNGNTYIPTGEAVGGAGEKIGAVQYYSTDERTAKSKSNLFSNYFKVGTELYAMEGVDRSDVILIKRSENEFVKAVNKSNTKWGNK